MAAFWGGKIRRVLASQPSWTDELWVQEGILAYLKKNNDDDKVESDWGRHLKTIPFTSTLMHVRRVHTHTHITTHTQHTHTTYTTHRQRTQHTQHTRTHATYTAHTHLHNTYTHTCNTCVHIQYTHKHTVSQGHWLLLRCTIHCRSGMPMLLLALRNFKCFNLFLKWSV